MESRLLTAAEAAQELGVSRPFIYKLAALGPARGGIAAVRIGGVVRIPRQVIEELIAGAGPTPAPTQTQAAD